MKQAQRFFEQGIVTKNDVLRFQLQQANVSLTEMEIENNRKIINYNLDILLGLPENTEIEIQRLNCPLKSVAPLSTYIAQALCDRQELQQLDLQNKVADYNIKTIKANTKPTLVLVQTCITSTPTALFHRPTNLLLPITIGANISWNIGILVDQ